MGTLLKKKGLSALILGILLAALLTVMMPVQVYGDAAVEDYWNTAYSVDYDVTVDAPDGGVNFRWGPGTKYEKVQSGMIPNGTVLHIETVAKADNGKEWGCAKYGDNYGWVYLGQTKKVSSSAPASSSSQTTSTPTAVNYNVEVKAPDGGVNIRSGPGTSYDKLQSSLIPNGTVLHITETAKAANGKDWGFTEYNGLKGWVYLGQTAVTTAAATAPAQTQPAQAEQTQPAASEPAEEPVVEPDVDETPDSDALVEDEPEQPEKSGNPMTLLMAAMALVILALIVTVVLLLARRKR